MLKNSAHFFLDTKALKHGRARKFFLAAEALMHCIFLATKPQKHKIARNIFVHFSGLEL